jgi:hypothetical protein
MKLKITKLKQHVMPTYVHIDSTDVIENDYTFSYSNFFLNQLSKCCHVGISHWLFDIVCFLIKEPRPVDLGLQI